MTLSKSETPGRLFENTEIAEILISKDIKGPFGSCIEFKTTDGIAWSDSHFFFDQIICKLNQEIRNVI